jgi:hypothetical protein
MIYGVCWKRFLRDFYSEVKRDNVFNGTAALGFYLTLGIFPGTIFVMAVAPYLPTADVDQAIMGLLGQVLPAAAADTFAGVVAEVANKRRSGMLEHRLRCWRGQAIFKGASNCPRPFAAFWHARARRFFSGRSRRRHPALDRQPVRL